MDDYKIYGLLIYVLMLGVVAWMYLKSITKRDKILKDQNDQINGVVRDILPVLKFCLYDVRNKCIEREEFEKATECQKAINRMHEVEKKASTKK